MGGQTIFVDGMRSILILATIILGIIEFIRGSNLSSLTSKNFPDIDPAKFTEWHQIQKKGRHIYLWVTLITFCVLVGLSFISSMISISAKTNFILLIVILVGWIFGMNIAGLYNKEAKELKSAIGIKWPK